MFEAIFSYNGNKTIIQCNKNDKMKKIFQNYSNKILIDINSIYYLYGGEKLNDSELTLEEIATDSDKEFNQVNIIVNDINISSPAKKFESSKDIICPICKESAQIEINDYKVSIYDLQNKHKMTDIPFDQFKKTQEIDISKIQCNICKTAKSNTCNNIFYRCYSCDKNLCILCYSKHNKDHEIINYNQKNYICKIHAHPYTLYCNTCKKNICIYCEKSHNNHDLLSFGKEIENIENLKSQNENLRKTLNIFKNNIEEIKSILDKIVYELEEYYKIKDNIINNFNYKELNYEMLHNIKIFSESKIQSDLNEIISKDDIEVKLHNIFKIYSKMFSKIENIQKKEKVKLQNENSNYIQKNEINDLNISKYNNSDTNNFGDYLKNDSNQFILSSSNNYNSTKEIIRIKQNENIPVKKDIFKGNFDSCKSDITNNIINEIKRNETSFISGNKNSDSNNNGKTHDKINESEEKNINDNKKDEIKNNNEISEYKDIYSNIEGEKIKIIFTMPNKEKKDYKIPSNFTNKEIYYTAYNLCEYSKDEFEYNNLLILYYNGNLLNNDDSIEKLKNDDEIEIKQVLIISCLDFSELIKNSKTQIRKSFSFLDSANKRIHVDLPNDLTITEIIDHIESIFKMFLDPNRVKFEFYFRNKILERKNKEIGNINRFKKLNDVNITIKIKNKVCLKKIPGRILEVSIFDDENKLISKTKFGTLEKIKDFYGYLKNELTKKNIIDFNPSFEIEGKELDLNEDDERTFFSINVKNNFKCFLNSMERRRAYFSFSIRKTNV